MVMERAYGIAPFQSNGSLTISVSTAYWLFPLRFFLKSENGTEKGRNPLIRPRNVNCYINIRDLVATRFHEILEGSTN